MISPSLMLCPYCNLKEIKKKIEKFPESAIFHAGLHLTPPSHTNTTKRWNTSTRVKCTSYLPQEPGLRSSGFGQGVKNKWAKVQLTLGGVWKHGLDTSKAGEEFWYTDGNEMQGEAEWSRVLEGCSVCRKRMISRLICGWVNWWLDMKMDGSIGV